jgi:hypothetical protein
MISIFGDYHCLKLICKSSDNLITTISIDSITILTSNCSSYVIIENKIRYVKHS